MAEKKGRIAEMRQNMEPVTGWHYKMAGRIPGGISGVTEALGTLLLCTSCINYIVKRVKVPEPQRSTRCRAGI